MLLGCLAFLFVPALGNSLTMPPVVAKFDGECQGTPLHTSRQPEQLIQKVKKRQVWPHSQKLKGERTQSQKIPLGELTTAIRKNFGSKVRIVSDTQPFYLRGDFNGDGFTDIAVLINPEGSQHELKLHGVRYIEVDPSSAANGKELELESATFQYCLGVAIMHGTKEGWALAKPGVKYLFYECFTPFRLIPRSTRIRRRYRSVRESPPKLKGDAIHLYLERDAAAIVYWTGKTYRGYYQ